MSENEYRDDEYYDDERYDEEEEGDGGPHSDKLDLIHRTPWWIISVIFHAALLLMAAMWTISQASDIDEFSIFQELSSIRRQRLNVAPLAICIDSVKCQRGLP